MFSLSLCTFRRDLCSISATQDGHLCLGVFFFSPGEVFGVYGQGRCDRIGANAILISVSIF